jgi:hypothetical protein
MSWSVKILAGRGLAARGHLARLLGAAVSDSTRACIHRWDGTHTPRPNLAQRAREYDRSVARRR